MKEQRKCIVAVLATLLVVAILISVAYPVLEMKDSEDRYSTFYSCEKNFDVLYFGNSHVMNGFSSMRLWKEYGFSCCSLAGPGMRFPTSYWLLEEALTRNCPSLVILDCSSLQNVKAENDTSYNHIAFDKMPISKVKIRAIMDLYDGSVHKLAEFLFPFFIYHNRWSTLKADDFRSHKNAMCGYDVMFLREDQGTWGKLEAEESTEIDNYDTQYLKRMVERCREAGITVLLTVLPADPEPRFADAAAWTRKYAAETGLFFIGPEEVADVVDIHTDFAYKGHMNYWGAMKTTDFLGAFLSSHYELVDTRKTSDAAYWQKLYDQYSREIIAFAEHEGVEPPEL